MGYDAHHKRTPAELSALSARVVELRDKHQLTWAVIAMRLGYGDIRFLQKLYWRGAERGGSDEGQRKTTDL